MRRLAIAAVALLGLAGGARADHYAGSAWSRCLVKTAGRFAMAGFPKTDVELVQAAVEICQPERAEFARELADASSDQTPASLNATLTRVGEDYEREALAAVRTVRAAP